MGIRKSRALAVALGLGLCLALLGAGPALAAPGTIEGRVSEPTEDEGLAEIEVCAIPATAADPPEACVQSEDGSGPGPRGHYEITGLEPGNYKLRFTPSPESQYVYQYYLRKLRLEGANVVEVEDGGVTANKNAVLDIGGRVAGKVTDSTGVPLGQIEVCVFSPLAPEFGEHCTETVPNGKYEILGLQTGSYVAEFFADPSRRFFTQYYNLAWDLEEAEQFFVGAGEETPGIDAELEGWVELEGTVTEAGTGRPLAGIGACALDPELEWVEGCALSDAEGHYEIGELFPWEYVVSFSVSPGPGIGEDGFRRQYYDEKDSFAEASAIDAFVPGLYQDIDARLTPGPEVFPAPPTPSTPPPEPTSPPSSSSSAPSVTSPPPPHPRRCRKGFRKKLVQGRKRCVRVKHRKKAKRHGGRHGARHPAKTR